MLAVVALLFLAWLRSSCLLQAAAAPEPWFPLQFSGNLEVTSYLLADDSTYPPSKRRMTIAYDYVNKRARADIEAGYEAAKYYIRRYDTKNEYMVRLPPIEDCKRSYLGETMPFPEIPAETTFVEETLMNGEVCNHFVFREHDTNVHMFFSLEGHPVRLFLEQVDEDTGLEVPLQAYDFSDVSLGAPDESWFELPAEYDHKSCVRHIGGFPYLHVFHYFVRF